MPKEFRARENEQPKPIRPIQNTALEIMSEPLTDKTDLQKIPFFLKTHDFLERIGFETYADLRRATEQGLRNLGAHSSHIRDIRKIIAEKGGVWPEIKK